MIKGYLSMEIITTGTSVKEYLDSVHGKSIIVSTGSIVKQVPDKGRYSFIICGNDGQETYSEYEYINGASYFCCILQGFLKALNRLDKGSEAVFVTSKQQEFDVSVPDERRLFDELCRRTDEKHIKAEWLSVDKENELNKAFISSYIEEKAPGFLGNMLDYWGCPMVLFDYEIVENDDIERCLDEKSGDILIVSVPSNIVQKNYQAISMMRAVVNNNAKVLIYNSSDIFTNKTEAFITGMLELVKRLSPGGEKTGLTVYIATQEKPGFGSDSSLYRGLCDQLYKEIKKRGYKAVEIRLSDSNETLKKRQGYNNAKTKSDILRGYIEKHKKRAGQTVKTNDPDIKSYIIENYL